MYAVIDFANLKSQMIGTDLLEQPPLAPEDVDNPLQELTEAAVEKLLLPPMCVLLRITSDDNTVY